MPFTPTPQVLTTTMVNTLNAIYQMWVVGPSQFASLSPVTLQPFSQTPVNSNFVNAWVQQNQDQNVLNSLQVYPVGFVPSIIAAPIRISSAVIITPPPPSLVPTVINSTFGLSTISLTAGQTIGQVIATNSPTSWAILSGGTAFAISSTGSLTLAASGTALQNTSGTQTMVVQATNAVGSGSGTIIVNLVATLALSGGRAKGPGVTSRLSAPTGTVPLLARSKITSKTSNAFLQVPIALISGSGAMLLDHSGNALTYQQH